MAAFFRNPIWRRIFPNMHFRRHRYVLNRSPNVSTNFGDDGSNTKEISTVFRNPLECQFLYIYELQRALTMSYDLDLHI